MISGLRGLALPALSGAVMVLATPPLSLVPVVFVGLVPLFLWIDRPLSAREMIRGAAVFGFLFVLGQGWSIFNLARYAPAGAILGVFAVLMLVTTWLVFPVTLNVLHHARPIALPLVAPFLWVVTEHARSFGDLAIPYIVLGHLLAPAPRLIQAADLAGVYGLSAWVVLVNALLARAIARRTDRRRAVRAAAAALLAFALPLAYGIVRWGQVSRRIETAEAISVAVFQPNIAQELKWSPRSIPVVFDRVSQLITRAENGSPRIVIGPESTVPVFMNEAAVRLPPRIPAGGAPLLLGIITGIGQEDRRPGVPGILRFDRQHNSALLVAADRTVLARYDKRLLAPMGERIPFQPVLGALSLLVENRFGRFEAGGDNQLLDIPGTGPAARAGVLICYEAVFPRLVAATRADGADFLVNITNDAWFGRTSFAWLFAQVCALRAVENRCAVVRAANTGISAFYDPLGRPRDATPVGEEAVIRSDVPLLRGGTFYSVAGDFVVWISYAALAAFLLVAWRSHRGLHNVTR